MPIIVCKKQHKKLIIENDELKVKERVANASLSFNYKNEYSVDNKMALIF